MSHLGNVASAMKKDTTDKLVGDYNATWHEVEDSCGNPQLYTGELRSSYMFYQAVKNKVTSPAINLLSPYLDMTQHMVKTQTPAKRVPPAGDDAVDDKKRKNPLAKHVPPAGEDVVEDKKRRKAEELAAVEAQRVRERFNVQLSDLAGSGDDFMSRLPKGASVPLPKEKKKEKDGGHSKPAGGAATKRAAAKKAKLRQPPVGGGSDPRESDDE